MVSASRVPPGDHNESLGVLLLAAKADPAFGDELRTILRLPVSQRRATINAALEAMRIKRADPLLVQAVTLLTDEAEVARVLELLER